MQSMVSFSRKIKEFSPPEARFVAGLYLLLAVLFALLRTVLLLRNSVQAEQIPISILVKSFLVGLRFDMAIASYLLIPLFLALLVLRGREKRWAVLAFGVLVALLTLAGVAEAEFYREFESRFNALVFEYLSHPTIVGGMIWEGYPVLSYLAVWILFCVLWGGALRWLYRRILTTQDGEAGSDSNIRSVLLRTMGTTVLLTLMVFVSRGGFQSQPLRWGDAFFSEVPFANHLALNGVFTLGRSGWDKIYGKQESWVKVLPEDEALQLTRSMVLQTEEKLLDPQNYPLLRQPAAAANSPLVAVDRPVNVVVILMENFSARFSGVLGAPESLTPEFDVLARDGILFSRAFSSGTHTHQGVYASLTSFPNVPGYEYLMKMMEANQEFSSLPLLFTRRGYESIFLYNGLLSWDNKEGFFRQHGMEHFVGTSDYRNPTFVDPVWGVSDHDVYTRANEEFRRLNEKGPFFGTILTLSDHSPFNLPESLPFERIEKNDGMDGRWNTMRYADWALGEFFRQARQEDYFDNTLFVVTGDHGFAHPPMITGMQLERFHVPLLFYAPDLLGTDGERRDIVASQVDIGPSILGLLGMNDSQQGWGRNLFAAAPDDRGFAVIKPSGGEDRVALIEGDYLLEVAPKEKPRLYRYNLGHPPSVSENILREHEALADEMEKRLHAYVETAILSLHKRALGIPEEIVTVENDDHRVTNLLPASRR
jgi:phosphoglycerol transferase MdoB-like AlkP superfamily enzyme